MHIKLTNGQPEIYSIGQLRRDNPKTSFPKAPSDVLLAEWGVYTYTVQDQPTADYMTQTITPTAIAQTDGVWVQGWEVGERPVDDAKRNVRAHRDALLADTDWVVAVSYERGESVPSAWVSYRQALRDVTAQTGFPFAVDWPTKPE